MQGLKWLATNDERVRKLCTRLAINFDVDDAYGRAIDALIDKYDAWAASYDASRCASLDAWILISLGYALRVRVNPKIIMQQLTDQIEAGLPYNNGEPIEIDWDDGASILDGAMRKLTNYEQFLVVARHVHKLNFTDIADQLGVSKGTIRSHYLKAIDKARNA